MSKFSHHVWAPLSSKRECSVSSHPPEQCPPPTQPAAPQLADKDEKKAWEGRKLLYSLRDPALLSNSQIQNRQRVFSPKTLSFVWRAGQESDAELYLQSARNVNCDSPRWRALIKNKLLWHISHSQISKVKKWGGKKIEEFAYLLHSSWKPHYHTCSHAFPSREHYRQLP